MCNSFLGKSRNSKGDFLNILYIRKHACIQGGSLPCAFFKIKNKIEKCALKIPWLIA